MHIQTVLGNLATDSWVYIFKWTRQPQGLIQRAASKRHILLLRYIPFLLLHPATLSSQLLKSRAGLKHVMACFQAVHLRIFSQCEEIRAGRVHTQTQELESIPKLHSLDIHLPLGWEANFQPQASKGCRRISNRGDPWEYD